MKRKIYIVIALFITLITLSSCNKKLTVTFNYVYKVEEVTVKKGQTVEKPIDPEREGYTFQKWTYRGQPYDFSQKVEDNITLFAEYTKIKDTMLSFSFDIIAELLKEKCSYYISKESLKYFRTGERSISIEFASSKKFINVSANGKNVVYANVAALQFSTLFGEYIDIILSTGE